MQTVTQIPLFDDRIYLPAGPGRVHRDDPETSRNAAAKITGTKLRKLALEALRRAGSEGLTDFELADRLGIRPTSAGTRRKELEEVGLTRRTKLRRLTPSGNPAIVHVATDVVR